MRSMATTAIVLFGLLGCGFVARIDASWTPPALAQIVAGGEYLCAATIVDDYYVVTAASCVDSLDVNTTDVFVKVGTTKSGKTLLGATPQSTRAISITTDSSSFSFGMQSSCDIAMVKVESKFQYSGSVMWASPTYQTISTSYLGSVALWSSLKTQNDQVLSAPVKAITSTECKTYLSSVTVNNTQTCLLPTISTSKPCEADLGAPFYRNELLYGIVSYTPGCDDSTYPVVVTNVGDAISFMVETMSGYTNAF